MRQYANDMLISVITTVIRAVKWLDYKFIKIAVIAGMGKGRERQYGRVKNGMLLTARLSAMMNCEFCERIS